MLRQFKEYFGFSKKELNGLLVLCFLLVLISVLPYIVPLFQSEDPEGDLLLRKEVMYFVKEDKRGKAPYRRPAGWGRSSRKEADRFQFDPNHLSLSGWLRLGLTERQARVIMNYLEKGGRFRQGEDLKKIYSLTPELYSSLAPYVRIAPSDYKDKLRSERVTHFGTGRSAKPVVVVELNSADSSLLESVVGIGPVLASRIVRYRERLGGFYRKEQLLEVYGIDSSRYLGLEKQVSVVVSHVRPININTVGFEELKRNPYLSYKQINAILQYRKQHGAFSSVDDLLKITILKEEILRKIAPYLSF